MTTDTPTDVGGERGGGVFTPLNIYQRRLLAKRSVKAKTFAKMKGEGLKYAYISIEQMKPAVEEAWTEAGIVCDIVDTEVEDVRPPWDKQSQYGDTSRWAHQIMALTLELVNVDEPSDRVRFTVYGEAKDNSDKMWNKLYTSALKNFYKVEYNIAESPKDDTDANQEAPPVRRRAPANDPFFSKAAPEPQAPAPQDLRTKIAEVNKQVREGFLTREQGAAVIETLMEEAEAEQRGEVQ